jgi:hypothetical protein
MKGPSERLKYDLRRVWECPMCKRRERTAGTVTFRHCSCQMKQLEGRAVVMKLVVDGMQRVGPAILIRHEQEVPTSASADPSLDAVEPTFGDSDPVHSPTDT